MYKRGITALLFAALLLTSVLSFIDLSAQNAEALSAVTFTTRATLSSDSTSTFRQVYHDTGATAIQFLDVTSGGIITQDKFNTSTNATSSFSNPILSELARQNPDSLHAISEDGGNTASDADDDTASTYWRNNVNAEAGAYIYANMTNPKKISEVQLYHGNATEIPAKIDLYVSNSTGFAEAARKTFTTFTYEQRGYWQFESNGNDASGNGNTATLINGATYASGKYGQAASFDGINDGADIGDNKFPSSVFSASTWIKTSDNSGTDIIIGNTKAGVGYRWHLYLSNGIIQFNGYAVASSTPDFIIGSSNLADGNWHHLAVVYTGTVAYLYVDGNLHASDTSATIHTTDLITTFGYNKDGNNWNGLMDDTHIHARALSQPEIQDLMKQSDRFYSLTLNSPVVGQYVKAQVNTWDDILRWRVNEFDVKTVSETPSNVQVSDINTYSAFYGIGRNATVTDNVIKGHTLYTDNLKGSWTFDDNSGTDSSGNSNTLTLNGDATYTTGRHGKALLLDGNGDSAQAADSASLDISSAFSFFTWINIASGQGTDRFIITKEDTSSNTAYDYTIASNNRLRPHLYINGVLQTFDQTTTLSTNTWYHVGFTYDGTTIRGYLNGAADGTLAVSGTIGTNTKPLFFGQRGDGLLRFSGLIDNPILLDRALSATEISNLYSSNLAPIQLDSSLQPIGSIAQSTTKLYLPLADTTGNGKLYLGQIPKDYGTIVEDDGLVGHWKFDEGSGTSAADSSGLGNTGTLVNTPTWVDGTRNKAIDFESSSSQYVSITDSSTLDLQNTISIVANVNLESSQFQEIVRKDGAFSLNVRNTNAIEAGIWSSGSVPVVGSNTILTNARWYHVVFTYDGSNYRLYINGVLDATLARTGSVDTNNNPVLIGSEAGTGRFFDGIIDDPRIYNRALSADEVKALYYGEFLQYTGTASVPIDESIPAKAIVVNDGASEVVYTIFAANATSIRATKFATSTQTATLLSTAMTAESAITDFQVIPLSGKIIVVTGSHVWELNTSTDAITQLLSDEHGHLHDDAIVPDNVHNWLTYFSQTYAISSSTRTYSDTNLPYLASAHEAYTFTPTAGIGPTRTAVFVDELERGLETGEMRTYNPPKYYYFSGLNLTVEAASASGTSWTVKSTGTKATVSIDPHHEFLQSIEPDPYGAYEDVHFAYCDFLNWNMTVYSVYVSEYDDCTEWHTYSEEGSPTTNPIPRNIFPFTATGADLVHAFTYTRYTLDIRADNVTDYRVTSGFKGITVDMQNVSAAGQVTMSWFFGNCYDVNFIKISTGATVQTTTMCADDDTTKSVIISEVLGFTFWSAPWGVTHDYNATSNILTTMVRHKPTPYTYNIQISNSSDILLINNNYSPASELDTRTFNLTSYSGTPFKLEVYNDENKRVYQAHLDNSPAWLSSISAEFANISFAGWNILMFLPIIFAAMFTRNTAGIGVGVTVAFIGAIAWLGVITLETNVIWLMVIVAVLGLLAYRFVHQ